MVAYEGEQILRSLREAGDGCLLLTTSSGGTSVTVGGRNLVEGSPDRARACTDAVQSLEDDDFLRQTGKGVFELTSKGARLADALAEEAAAEARVPDSCVLKLADMEHEVTFIGVNVGDLPMEQYGGLTGTHIGKGMYVGHAGFFSVGITEERQVFGVLLGHLSFQYLEQQESVPVADLIRLFKRPGVRSVRDYLLGEQEPDKNGRLLYPQGSPWNIESIDAFVEASDDPRARILEDCERDALRLLYEARQQRKPGGVTAAEIAACPAKSRFYSARHHIRWVLEDLLDKGLIKTPDSVQYEIEVRRLADARRVIAGLPSDQLFDAEPPAQRAAYVPESTNEFDAFLCHASEDKDGIVAPFAKAMEQAGLKPWLDSGQIKWGDNLVGKVQEGLSRSRYVVLFLSSAFLGKPWPETELNTAMSMEIGGRTLVLPVLLGLAHDELKTRYPMVSAKVYRPAPNYDPATPVGEAFIADLVRELKSLLESD